MSAGRSESSKVGCHHQLSEQNRPTHPAEWSQVDTNKEKIAVNLSLWKTKKTTWVIYLEISKKKLDTIPHLSHIGVG